MGDIDNKQLMDPETEFDGTMEIDIAEIRQEGKDEGIAEGIQQTKREIVIAMLEMGSFSVETIAQIVDISVSEVEAIRAENNIYGTPRNITVGSRVTFGSYPQSSYTPEPITWRVLAVENGRAVMISESLLDCKRFDKSSNYWYNSELRAWLNGEFRNRAFSAEEQRKLVEHNGDYVACLCIYEAEQYFSETEEEQCVGLACLDRVAKPTAYAMQNGCYADADCGTGWWWLRSSGYSCNNGNLVAVIDVCGGLNVNGNRVDDNSVGVRPVISVSL